MREESEISNDAVDDEQSTYSERGSETDNKIEETMEKDNLEEKDLLYPRESDDTSALQSYVQEDTKSEESSADEFSAYVQEDTASYGEKSEMTVDEVLFSRQALEGLSRDAIFEKLEMLEKEVKHLKIENDVLFHFLEKNDAEPREEESKFREAKGSVASIKSRSMASIKRGSVASIKRAGILSKSGRRFSKLSSAVTFGTAQQVSSAYSESFGLSQITQLAAETPKINMTQRTDLVLREMDEIQAELTKETKKWHDAKFKLVANIEELENRQTELEHSLESFDKFKAAYDQITLEKFVRFMEEWSKKSRLMVDKLRLRYSSLKVQYQKLSALLVQKQLIGENLQEIDFEQLRIENVHLVNKIEKKTLLLFELKHITGAGNLKLSQQKGILLEKMQEKEKLKQAIEKKEREIARSDNEILKLYEELEMVKKKHADIRDKVTTYTAPDIMEYIRKKDELDNLKRDLKIWSRKKNVKSLAFNVALTKMKNMLKGKEPDPEWFE